MNNPKVSILIPTYNYGRFLNEAVESVLMQNFSDFEIVIIDDCSDDNTNEIMELLICRDSRIRYKRNSVNLGMVPNWNLCLQEARGEYVRFLFGDDFLVSPKALETFVGILDGNLNVSLVGSSRIIVDKESQVKEIWEFYDQDMIKEGAEVISSCLFKQRNYIGEPSAVMFRKNQATRGFDPRYRQLVDLEMWFHLLEQGAYAYVCEPYCAFRVHNQQQTSKNAAINATVNDTTLLFREYLHKPYLPNTRFTRAYLRYDHIYHVWKSYWGKGVMTRDEALDIVSRYGIVRFFIIYPLYKIYKPLRKLLNLVRNHVGSDRCIHRL